MLFSDLSFDLPPLLQIVVTALVIALGLLQLIKVSASRYLVVDARFEGGDGHADMTVERRVASAEPKASGGEVAALCFVCGGSGTKKCSGCRAVRYWRTGDGFCLDRTGFIPCCLTHKSSSTCQLKHWREDHSSKCKDLKFSNSLNSKSSQTGVYLKRKGSGQVDNSNGEIALIPARGTSKGLQTKKVLFPYEEFVKLFNWDNPGFAPCGLLNCGNSCFANVVLQCLACTRPLVAYLLERGHSRKCNRNDWCFLCELESHIHRVNQSLHPFSPINILSRLPNIGGNLGYGKQEDAHEFMRFAIDTMQSVFLDEFGGESVLDHTTQLTTLIQYIFGGQLQSEVICTKCDNVSYCYENMMDLTVEIQGDAVCLENCLDQFTKREWLDGENMYKCDRCNGYVKAWKRLTVHQAPNILTITLKRFQSGRFGKLNKRVTFPEMLDLGPYMSESGNGTDLYRLYAVVVHVDMLNASFFGHYICYTQDFSGNWYRIDDCKVMKVELEEVLAQGAYMLLYSRLHVRQPSLKPFGPSMGERERLLGVQEGSQRASDMFEQYGNAVSGSSLTTPGDLSSDISLQSSAESADMNLVHSTEVGPAPIREDQKDLSLDFSQAGPSDPACSGVGLVHLSNEAEKDPSIEIIHRESIDSDFLSKQSIPFRSNTTLSQENGISSSADCNDEEVNETASNHSNVLFSSESPSDDPFSRNSSATSAAPNANLDNASTFAVEANGVLMHNQSTSTTGTTRSGKAFRMTDAVRDKAISSCRRKPLFTPGFLDKPTRKKAALKDDKAQSRPEALGGTQFVSSGNQFCEPVLSHLDDHKVDVHEDVQELLPANGMGLLNSKELVMPQSPNGDKNGGTVRISPTSHANCNGTSSIDNLPSTTPNGNGRDASLDFRNSEEVLDRRSSLQVCKREASCNGFLVKAISSHNGSNGCERDQRSLTICENGSISEPESISRDVPSPETDSVRVSDFLPDNEPGTCGSGACWENSKDTNLNCKRPRRA